MNTPWNDLREFKDADEILRRQRPGLLGLSLYLTIALLLALTLWATLTTIPVNVKARGQVLPKADVIPVDAAVAGRIAQIDVNEGQRVTTGDRILVLEHIEHESLILQARERLDEARRRISSERESLTLIEQRDSLDLDKARATLQRLRDEHNLAVDAQRESDRLSQVRVTALERRMRLASNDRARLTRDLKSRLQQAKTRLKISTSEWETGKQLFDKGNLPRSEFERLEAAMELAKEDVNQADNALTEQGAELSRLQQDLDIARADADLQEIKTKQKLQELQSRRDEAAANLKDVEANAGMAAHAQRIKITAAEHTAEDLQREVNRLQLVGQRFEVVASGAGLITGLESHTPGQYVATGTNLALIVPEHSDLVIEAWVDNRDTGQIRVDQPVTIKVDAFPHSRYGVIPGRVENLSPHPFHQRDGRFRLRCRMNRPNVISAHGNHDARLGMHVTAEVEVNRESVLTFIFRTFRGALDNN